MMMPKVDKIAAFTCHMTNIMLVQESSRGECGTHLGRELVADDSDEWAGDLDEMWLKSVSGGGLSEFAQCQCSSLSRFLTAVH